MQMIGKEEKFSSTPWPYRYVYFTNGPLMLPHQIARTYLIPALCRSRLARICSVSGCSSASSIA